MAKKSLKEEIKEMERKAREESAPQIAEETKVSFDSWYHMRKDKIPSCHLKEILAADFKARNMPNNATIAEFDKALELYGVKLK